MREFQKRRRLKRFLHSRYAIAVLLVLCVLLVRAVWGVYGKYERSEELRDRTREELASLEARERSLSALTDSLDTDQGREREIRDRFGVVREGERMIVIVEDDEEDAATASAEEKSWWSRFIDMFKRD